MPTDTLDVTDNRSGSHYELRIEDGTIRAMDLRQVKKDSGEFGLMTFDPGFTNTAACRSSITYIDGARGILQYRGYPIEQLAEQSSYLETAYLLIHGTLPSRTQLDGWTREIAEHTFLHENIGSIIEGFRHDAHPMGVLMSIVGALSTFYPESKAVLDPEIRRKQIVRLIAKVPTVAAFCHRFRRGLPYVYPDSDLGYAGNFLSMMFRKSPRYQPQPVLERALDLLFVLHADHEQNCSTSTLRSVASSHADPYAAAAAAIAALYGPLHGGANEAVLRMLRQIGSVQAIPEFITRVRAGNARLMGFGHRVYRSYDPRAKIVKQTADRVFEVTGRNPLLDIALELERIALQDEYFVTRQLYPNVDFYSGLIYQSMGIPEDMFPVMFAIARTSGWLAQWQELMGDPDLKIARPRQIYTGGRDRQYIPIEHRDQTAPGNR